LWTVAGWDVTLTWALVGVVGSILITWVNFIGIKVTSLIQIILTIVIALVGILLIFGGATGGTSANMDPLFQGGIGAILAVVIMTPFMFVGFDVIPQAAEEINLKRKTTGKLLIFSVFLAIIWYVLIILSVGRALTPDQMANSTLVTADAMAAVFNSQFMGKILVIGGVGGILTSWIGFYIGGSRAIYALARANMLPAFLAKIHPKYKTPHNAILLIGIVSTIAPLFGRQMLVWLVDAGGLGMVIAWFFVAVSFLVLRKKEPTMHRPFKVAAGNLIGWLAVLLSFGIIALYMPGSPAALVRNEWIIVLLWAVLGIVFYTSSRKKFGVESSKKIMQEEIDSVLKL
jgi:APA family basic amino acid/polyamine antiporter